MLTSVSCCNFFCLLIAEMKKFQKETEDALNKNMEALKQQISEDKKDKDQLTRDVKHLEDVLRQMAARNQELEGQVSFMVKLTTK